MGELSGGNNSGIQGEKISGDHAVNTPDLPVSKTDGTGDSDAPKGVPTDVDGVFADGEKLGMPVFDVSPEEFFNNMKMDRRRLRFNKDSNASKYMRTTKYNRPFWIRNSLDGYMRKIK